MAEAPSGTVTLLFTDIEGSTRLLQRAGGAYAGLLDQHHRLLRAAFEANGGYEVNTEGDAFFVAFTSANDAVAAAADAQQALARHEWPKDSAIQVRIGVHTGEPLFTAGGYVGLDVHRAARMAAAGHGGQVVVSQATRDLLEKRFNLLNLGEHRLKDLDEPEWLYQLGEGAFPPLKSLNNTNLPRPATKLVGRQADLRALQALVLEEGCRLVTVTGPGGAGKTRVAVEAALELLPEFRNGVFFVALAPIEDPQLVTTTIAATLGVREQSGKTFAETLQDHFADKRLLLLLDNFEQVVDAAPFVASLVDAAAGLTVVVTSREPLRLSGEHEYPLPPLPEDDAVALFSARARAKLPEFAITPENERAVAEICRRVDGLPLAVELAAARIKLLGHDALLARLEHRLDLLTGGSRDLPARQQTLRATIEWSFDLLPEAEQRFFAALGIFVDGCTLEAAEEVCGADLDSLGSLLDKSLLRRRETSGAEVRFWMLHTIREFALESLEREGRIDELRGRHLAFFVDAAERAEPELKRAGQRVWLDQLENEHDNFRAALEHGLRGAGEVTLGARLAAALLEFWDIRGHLTEGRRWFDAVLARRTEVPPELAAEAARGSGHLALRQTDVREALALLREAADGFETVGRAEGASLALAALAFAHVHCGELEAAAAVAEQSLNHAQEATDPWVRACALSAKSVVDQQGDAERGRKTGEEALGLFRDVGDARNAAIWCQNLGALAMITGAYDRAEKLFEQALVSARTLGDEPLVGIASLSVASILLKRGEWEGARQALREGLLLAQHYSMRYDAAVGLLGTALLAANTGNAERAARLLGAYDAVLEGSEIVAYTEERQLRAEAAEAVGFALPERKLEVALAEGRETTFESALGEALQLVGSWDPAV